MKCDGTWSQQQGVKSGSSGDPIPTEVPSLVGLDWLFEHTDSEPDDTPQSNPGELLYCLSISNLINNSSRKNEAFK